MNEDGIKQKAHEARDLISFKLGVASERSEYAQDLMQYADANDGHFTT